MPNRIPDNIHGGHRGRMRAKLKKHGSDVFETYELLEMLLYHIIPYKDTNPTAKQLIFYFGSLDGVLSASREELMKVSGVGARVADFLVAVGKTGRCAMAKSSPSEVNCLKFESFEAVKRFFINYFEEKTETEIVMILLDSSMRSIRMETVYKLDYDSGAVKSKPFVDLAVSSHAAAAIIAHNHLNGQLLPSMGDRATNQMVARSLNSFGITLVEHYVVCGKSCFGLVNHISEKFAEDLLI